MNFFLRDGMMADRFFFEELGIFALFFYDAPREVALLGATSFLSPHELVFVGCSSIFLRGLFRTLVT
jgi:hypothetical protein